MLCDDSNEGVAELNITKQLAFFARTTEKSLALIINCSSCLYELSCSSSITIKPSLLKGKKRADLVPIINFS